MIKYIKLLLADEDGEPCTETHAGFISLFVVIYMIFFGENVSLPMFNGILTFTAACFGFKGYGRITLKKNRGRNKKK